MNNPKIYEANKNYTITFADKDGNTNEYKITPEEDLSIAKMIMKCKSANKNYIKLIDIKEESRDMRSSKKESKKLQESKQEDLKKQILAIANKNAEEDDYYGYYEEDWKKLSDDEKVTAYFDDNEGIDIAKELNLPTYNDNLELSHEQVLYRINKDIDEEEYLISVKNTLEDFEQQNDVEEGVWQDGRSGKHIIMKPTQENILRFYDLQEKYKEVEKAFIEYFNKEDLDESKKLQEDEDVITLYDVVHQSANGIDISDVAYDMEVYVDYDENSEDSFDKLIKNICKDLHCTSYTDTTATVDLYKWVEKNFDILDDIFDVPASDEEEEMEFLVCDIMPGIFSGYTSDSVYTKLNDEIYGNKVTEGRASELEAIRKYKDPNVKIETNADLSANVQEYYRDNFDDGDFWKDINSDITFQDVVNALNEGKDIYDLLEVGDSVVRENVFNALCDLTELDYDVFYYKWLSSDLTESKKIKAEEVEEIEYSIRNSNYFGDGIEICTWKASSPEEAVSQFLDSNPSYSNKGKIIAVPKTEKISETKNIMLSKKDQEKYYYDTYTDTNGTFYDVYKIDGKLYDVLGNEVKEKPKLSESKKLQEDEEPEDQTQTQIDVENAVEEVENATDTDKLAVDITNSSIDVLITDEETAIEGYNAFLTQARETLMPSLYEVLEQEINEIIKDEEDHINKLNTIKSAFHLDNAPLDESKKLNEIKSNKSKGLIEYEFTQEDIDFVQNLLGDTAEVKIDKENVLQINAPTTEYINGGIINIKDSLIEKIKEYIEEKYPEVDCTVMNRNTTIILNSSIDPDYKEN